MDHLTSLIAYIAIIAVGAERITEIIKRTFLKDKEINGGIYQLMTFAFGFMLSMIQPPEFKVFNFNPVVVSLLIGLAVSGTSSFWYEILSSLNSVNDSLKQKKN